MPGYLNITTWSAFSPLLQVLGGAACHCISWEMPPAFLEADLFIHTVEAGALEALFAVLTFLGPGRSCSFCPWACILVYI
jgi:hypothetical protein